MGHYTQIRGWLRVTDSKATVAEIADKLEAAKLDYAARYPESSTWIFEGTHCPRENNGFNGETFIFIGVELKNYDQDYDRWLDVLLEHFPHACGRWDVQDEQRSPAYYPGDEADCVLTIRIRNGKRTDDWQELAWC